MDNVPRKDFFSFLGFLESEGYSIINEKRTMYVEVIDPKGNIDIFHAGLSNKAKQYIATHKLKVDFEFGEIVQLSERKFRIPLIVKSSDIGWTEKNLKDSET